jgi:hypothetical protein
VSNCKSESTGNFTFSADSARRGPNVGRRAGGAWPATARTVRQRQYRANSRRPQPARVQVHAGIAARQEVIPVPAHNTGVTFFLPPR